MTENKGDLISREALKKALGKAIEHKIKWTLGDIYMFNSDEILNLIDNAPTVEQICNQIAWEQGYEAGLAQGKSERPKGEWTQEDYTDEMLNIWHCSNCKEDFCSEVGGHPKEWNYNFCPNCGAKMQNGGATDEP